MSREHQEQNRRGGNGAGGNGAGGDHPDQADRLAPDDAPASAAPAAAPASAAPAAQGPDLARAVLDAARASRTNGVGSKSGKRRSGAGGQGRRRGRRGYTGAGPDSRDPQLFGSLLAKFVRDRGWEKPVAEGAVFGAWDRVVGVEIAAKSRPVKLEDAELTVEAVSTAWATQLRLLAPKIIKQIAAEVGPNVVRRIRVHGPAAPSWRHGPRRVQGRGPGDTYG